MTTFTLQPMETRAARTGLALEVPRFPPGSDPPPAGSWESLLPARDFEADFPVFWHESLIKELVEDEIRFRTASRESWAERCWLLLGRILRAPDGMLYGKVERVCAALHVKASAASFEFTPETWAAWLEEVRGRDEVMLGWVHTHSIEHLTERGGEAEGEIPASSARQGEEEDPARSERSGLFLSIRDMASAYSAGFSAPFHLTCVLDSDACLRANTVGLHGLLGVWGWYRGRLSRRSIHVVKETGERPGPREVPIT